MRAPADSYWSLDECRWVPYAGAIDIPDQRDDEPLVVTLPVAPAEAVVLDGARVPNGSRNDLHR